MKLVIHAHSYYVLSYSYVCRHVVFLYNDSAIYWPGMNCGVFSCLLRICVIQWSFLQCRRLYPKLFKNVIDSPNANLLYLEKHDQYILQNIFFCVRLKKENHMGLERNSLNRVQFSFWGELFLWKYLITVNFTIFWRLSIQPNPVLMSTKST